MAKELRWAVLGTGVIANEMAQALEQMGRSLYAVGNRTHEKAVAFAEKYHVTKVYDDFHEMFTDPEIDIIYITTPHNTHIEFLRQALANGKHVLCEKSITLNSDELNEALQIAEKHHRRLLLSLLDDRKRRTAHSHKIRKNEGKIFKGTQENLVYQSAYKRKVI